MVRQVVKQVPHVHLLLSLTAEEYRTIRKYEHMGERRWCTVHDTPYVVCPCDPQVLNSMKHLVPYVVINQEE